MPPATAKPLGNLAQTCCLSRLLRKLICVNNLCYLYLKENNPKAFDQAMLYYSSLKGRIARLDQSRANQLSRGADGGAGSAAQAAPVVTPGGLDERRLPPMVRDTLLWAKWVLQDRLGGADPSPLIARFRELLVGAEETPGLKETVAKHIRLIEAGQRYERPA